MHPQSPPGRWYFVPELPAQPMRDTRFIRTSGEWFLFIGCIVALFIVIGLLSGSGVDALIGMPMCLGLAALVSLI